MPLVAQLSTKLAQLFAKAGRGTDSGRARGPLKVEQSAPMDRFHYLSPGGRRLVEHTVSAPPGYPRDPGAMRVVCIADTHNEHESLRLPPGDLLVHAGDCLTASGTRYEEQLQRPSRACVCARGTAAHRYVKRSSSGTIERVLVEGEELFQSFATWLGHQPFKHKVLAVHYARARACTHARMPCTPCTHASTHARQVLVAGNHDLVLQGLGAERVTQILQDCASPGTEAPVYTRMRTRTCMLRTCARMNAHVCTENLHARVATKREGCWPLLSARAPARRRWQPRTVTRAQPSRRDAGEQVPGALGCSRWRPPRVRLAVRALQRQERCLPVCLSVCVRACECVHALVRARVLAHLSVRACRRVPASRGARLLGHARRLRHCRHTHAVHTARTWPGHTCTCARARVRAHARTHAHAHARTHAHRDKMRTRISVVRCTERERCCM